MTRFALRIDLAGQVGRLSPFLVVLVDATCTTIEYTEVEATSCGILRRLEQCMHALD